MSVTIAIIIHVIAVVLLVIGYQMKHEPKVNPQDTINTVKATVINTDKIEELNKRKEDKLKQEH